MSEPHMDDLADTLTANLRTMKAANARIDTLEYAINSLVIVLCLLAVAGGLLIIQKVRH